MKQASLSLLNRIQNLTVEEFTTPCSFSVSSEIPLEKAETLMSKEGIRHLPVLNGKKDIVGIISDRDIHLARRMNPKKELLVKDFMQPDPYCASVHTKISEVALQMSTNKYGSAIIVDGEGEIGIFTSIDALNALIEIVRGEI